MTSSTGVQRGASIPVLTLSLAPASAAQRALAAFGTLVGRAVRASRDYQAAGTPAGRTAVLRRFAADA